MRFTPALAVFAASMSTMVGAQTQRDLDSHEHGSAFLNIALDGNTVFIELESPWNNFVGFEHAPNTDEQHKLVDDTMAALNDPGQLFAFDGGNCEVAELSVESSIGDEHDDEHDDEHADHDDDETHSSVLASYSFNCGDASKLAAIDVTLLERWSGFEDLDVQMAGPKGQSGVELSPQQIRVDITQIQ